MYPGFIVNYEDQSDISTTLPITEVRNKPLFGAIFTADKGPEGWNRVSGEDFFKTYGKSISFDRHGQPLLQAAMTINAGAELFCKRLVAEDATLANIGIAVKIEDETVEKTIDDDVRTQVTTHNIIYKVYNSEEADTIEKVVEDIKSQVAEDEYLLYVITDNGRGKSKKSIKITPNYKVSKSLSYQYYNLSVLEGSKEIESIGFSINPALIVSGESISLGSMINNHSTQIKCVEFNEDIEAFATIIAGYAGIVNDSIYSIDVLFGKKNNGTKIDSVAIGKESKELSIDNGLTLDGGSNGALKDKPFDLSDKSVRDAYVKIAVEALNGTFDSTIYNVDQNMIVAFVDANYPIEVKIAIAALSNFREDFIYFKDMGLEITDMDKVQSDLTSVSYIDKDNNDVTKSKFVANYCQSYDVIDPYTKKQISVTIGYDLAQKLVAHCNNGCHLPTAGIKYNMTIDNAIYGTLSFAPTICPGDNQKETLDDLHVNYASYINNQLVLETLYTSQEKNSQWSYINNVMAIQEIVRLIRTRCPAIRYTFIDGEDLEKYKADVEEVIAPYMNNFKQLSLEFIADATYSANKIFYAALKVVYKDFVQTEWFNITALSTVETSES